MRKLLLAAMLAGLGVATQANADTPNLQWGFDSRAMSQQDCMKRAQFAMGEQGLQVNGGDGSNVAGAGANVAVLVTCLSLGDRTFIHVTGASPDSGAAERFRNGVRSIVMGPPS